MSGFESLVGRRDHIEREAGVNRSWRDALVDYISQAARPVEKYGHQVRLYALTREIGDGCTYDDDVVFAAAWLHDIGVFIGHRPEDPAQLEAWDHIGYAMRFSPGLLKSIGFQQCKIDAVIEAIRTHEAAAEPRSIEATIVRDADILEQLGAVGIMRAVCKIGRDTRYPRFTDVRPVLENALTALPPQLRLPRSRDLAAHRIVLLRDFLRSLESEAGERLY